MTLIISKKYRFSGERSELLIFLRFYVDKQKKYCFSGERSELEIFCVFMSINEKNIVFPARIRARFWIKKAAKWLFCKSFCSHSAVQNAFCKKKRSAKLFYRPNAFLIGVLQAFCKKKRSAKSYCKIVLQAKCLYNRSSAGILQKKTLLAFCKKNRSAGQNPVLQASFKRSKIVWK